MRRSRPSVAVAAMDPAGPMGLASHAAADRPAPWDRPQGVSRLALASVVVALVPIAVAVARAVHGGWLPVGDDAFFVLRSRDVFTHHIPLLGTWTSASLTVGTHLNNPGPMLFDLLAIPTTIGSRGAGVAVGAALLNASSVVGVAVLAHRRGGPVLTAMAMVVATALCWSMGSELLFDPWQPHSLLLAFLSFLMLVWSLACGDRWALPWAAFVGSLLLQTHLSYAYLVPALGAWGVVGLTVESRRSRRRVRRAAWIAAVVLVVCWVQPLVEQFTSDGDGNLTRLARTIGESSRTVGFGRGLRIVATVVGLPPWWVRPSFAHAFLSGDDPPRLHLAGRGAAVVAMAGVGAIRAWCIRDARGRGDRTSSRAGLTAALALVVGLVTAAKLPVGTLGIAPHQFRWLWPVAAFATFAVATTLLRRPLPATLLRRPPAPTRSMSVAIVAWLTAATVVLAVADLPTYNARAGPNADEWAIPVVRGLDRQLGSLQGAGPLLYDLGRVRFADPYGTAVMAELQRRDIEFRVDDEGMARQLGPARRLDSPRDRPRARLVVLVGDAARVEPRGADRVAFVDGLSGQEARQLSALEVGITRFVRQGGVRLDARGRAARRRGDPAALAASGGATDAALLLRSGALASLVERDLLVVPERWAAPLRRYAALRRQRDDQTVAIFLAPRA